MITSQLQVSTTLAHIAGLAVEGQCSVQQADRHKTLLDSCAPLRIMMRRLQTAASGQVLQASTSGLLCVTCHERQRALTRPLRATARRGAQPPAASGR